jgi:hypothetical protein
LTSQIAKNEEKSERKTEEKSLEKDAMHVPSPLPSTSKTLKHSHPSLTRFPQPSSVSLITFSSCVGHLTSWLEWDAERGMRRLRAGEGEEAAADVEAAAAAAELLLLGSSRLGS